MKNIKRVTALTLAMVMAGSLLAGCGGKEAEQPAQTADGTEASGGGKKELNILMEDVPDTDYVIDLLDDFEAATGIKVNIESVTYSIMHEKLLTQLTAKESNYDVLVVDNYWVGEFVEAGWMEDLGPYIEKSGFDTSNYVDTMWNMVGEVDGTAYMIPFYNYMFSLIYRTDVFEDPELQAAYKAEYGRDLVMPCDSMEEYVNITKFVTAQSGPKLCGTVNQAMRADPIAMEFCSYLYSCGGYFYDDQGNVTINDEHALKALELYCDSVQNASTEGAAGFALDEAFNVYSQGGAASYITHNWMLPKLEDPAQSQVAGLSGIANIPGGHAQNGGWGWAIPSNATDKDASWSFIEFIESFESCKTRALAGGSPTRTDVFNDEEVMAKYPTNEVVLEIMNNAMMIPILADAPQLVEVMGRELSEAVNGDKTPQEALDIIAQELEKMN
ncbi:MAG: extracellular solute-binding protein [Lachnospiraceae bacterium]